MVTAHWDTVISSPGVDDNGSGVVAVLEVARIVAIHHQDQDPRFPNSIVFALFDKEEVGCKGSEAFIRDFLVPTVVQQSSSQILVP